jgi:hypothetical protein
VIEKPGPAYDPNRLRRAATRSVQRLGDRRYRVEGRVCAAYYVDLNADIPCYCADAQFHGAGCLHELAARLADGDHSLILSLGEMLLTAERAMREQMRSRRKAS